jgi:hypothetical protein
MFHMPNAIPMPALNAPSLSLPDFRKSLTGRSYHRIYKRKTKYEIGLVTTDFHQLKCVACRGGEPTFTETEIEDLPTSAKKEGKHCIARGIRNPACSSRLHQINREMGFQVKTVLPATCICLVMIEFHPLNRAFHF